MKLVVMVFRRQSFFALIGKNTSAMLREVIDIFCSCMVIIISLMAVFMDLVYEKVDNQFLLIGLCLGAGYQVWMYGLRGMVMFLMGIAVPFLILYMLFYFRMLGSGDIKLLSVLGGFIGPIPIVKCIVWSFLLGAGISICVLLTCGNLVARGRYFINYIRQYMERRDFFFKEGIIPYYVKGKRMENIHFTVPVFMSIVLYVGGVIG